MHLPLRPCCCGRGCVLHEVYGRTRSERVRPRPCVVGGYGGLARDAEGRAGHGFQKRHVRQEKSRGRWMLIQGENRTGSTSKWRVRDTREMR